MNGSRAIGRSVTLCGFTKHQTKQNQASRCSRRAALCKVRSRPGWETMRARHLSRRVANRCNRSSGSRVCRECRLGTRPQVACGTTLEPMDEVMFENLKRISSEASTNCRRVRAREADLHSRPPRAILLSAVASERQRALRSWNCDFISPSQSVVLSGRKEGKGREEEA